MPNTFVFINCPFDDGYKDILYAIIFTVYRCGFIPRSALEEDNAMENRLSKIEKIIRECKFGIHDISRIEFNENGLPRFNMPFELGMFFGLKSPPKGSQKKIALVLEKQKYLYQQYISDISGIDTTAHNNDPLLVIKIVRDWLQAASHRKNIDGHLILTKEYKNFRKKILRLVKTMGTDLDRLTYIDYCYLIQDFLRLELGQWRDI